MNNFLNEIIKSVYLSAENKEDILNILGGDVEKGEKDSINLVLNKPTIEADKIIEYKGQEQKKFIFRPRNLNEYIGQEKAKKIIKVNVEKIKKLKPVHFLIDGLKGHGKTTLSYIISNLLNSIVYEIVASDVTQDKIVEMVNWINQQKNNVVVFIDEIHGLSPDIVEIFYPIMEDFKIYGKKIKPFVLIGATTEKNILVKKFSPFIDRFNVQITLERYTSKDISKILLQYQKQLYPQFEIDKEAIEKISRNCKFTPRIAISLLEDYLVARDIKEVLDMHNIVIDGLTKKDIQILETLYKNEKPIGEETMAMMLGLSRSDYKFLHESYLIEMGYMARGRSGRIILDKGIRLLENLNKEVEL